MFASSLTVGFGGSVGLEAPIVLTGSSIGSNIGNKVDNVKNSIAALEKGGDIRVEDASRLYRTEPQDFTDQDWFVNAVVRVATDLAPEKLLQRLGQLEPLELLPGDLPVQGEAPLGLHLTPRAQLGNQRVHAFGGRALVHHVRFVSHRIPLYPWAAACHPLRAPPRSRRLPSARGAATPWGETTPTTWRPIRPCGKAGWGRARDA